MRRIKSPGFESRASNTARLPGEFASAASATPAGLLAATRPICMTTYDERFAAHARNQDAQV